MKVVKTMLFGDILRNLLEERNLSQKQFAEELKIAPSTLGNYIRNIREPDYATLKRIASYFNVTTDYLLDHRSAQSKSQFEDELLRVFRSLTKDQQELYVEQGKAFISQNTKKAGSSNSGNEKKSGKVG